MMNTDADAVADRDDLVNMHRAQILRQQCNRHFTGKRVHDVVGALQMLTADALLALPGMTEEMALGAFDAIAGDVRNIIRERFLADKKH